MKPVLRTLGVVIVLLLLNRPLLPALAQGSLSPPGAPAPSMKTLDQIEPRWPISEVPFVITNPGSYYLVSNLNLTVNSNAITIAANDVVLDLKGFTISTSVLRGSGTGILLAGGNQDITISNGHITGGNSPYLDSGISFSGSSPVNVHVSNVTVTECITYGINLGTNNATLVDGCTVSSITGYGIEAGCISHCAAQHCGNSAIVANSTADDCFGESLNGSGVSAGGGANNCQGYSEGGGYAVSAGAANNCYGYSAGAADGVFADTANNCYGFSISSTGVYATTANNCEGLSDMDVGVYAQSAIGCYGFTSGTGIGDFGVEVNYIAIGCVAISYSTYSISGDILNSCYGNNSVNYAYHYNMPP